MKMHKKGYILTLSLLLVSVLVIIVTQLFYQASSSFSLTTTLVKREQAKMAALSGVQLAISALTVRLDEKKEGKTAQQGEKKAQPSKSDFYKKFLERIVPSLNRWQVVELKPEQARSMKVKFCITCEDGKINLNTWYDYEKHQFKSKQHEEAFMSILKEVQGITGDKKSSESILTFLKKRAYPLNDVTELLQSSDDYFATHVFYEPQEEQNKKSLYLTDLFTTWTQTDRLQPWLLSESLATCLGFAQAKKDDTQAREQMMTEWLKPFKEKVDWQKEWNTILKPIYQKDKQQIAAPLLARFNPTYAPTTFGVIAYGIVDEVVQKCYAILHFTENRDKVIVFLEKLYWV